MQQTRNNARRQTLGSVPPPLSTSSSRRRSVDPSSSMIKSIDATPGGRHAPPTPSGSTNGVGNHNGGAIPPKARPPRGRASMIPRVGRENAVPPTPPPKATNGSVVGGSAVKGGAAGSGMMSSGRRRSSIGGPGLGGERRQSVQQQQKTDPRPVNEKGFQQDCVNKLLSFLQANGYNHPISQKTLARPSGKDFAHIITFMLRLIDPAFQNGAMKLEDEIAMNFKALGYPLGISKTALVAAGSPHTWPTLLAALAWLMTRIQTLQSMNDEEEAPLVGGVAGSTNAPVKFESVEEMETKSDKFFFKYLSAAYGAFLKGDEKLQENLQYCLHDRLERDDKVLEMEIHQMEERNTAITERIDNLGRGEDELKALIEKRDGYATDLEQFHDLIEQMENHVATLLEKKKNRTEELEETQKKVKNLSGRVEELKKQIGNQNLSVKDVQKMENERKGVEEATERAIALKDQRQSVVWEIESEVESIWGDLEATVSDYNARIGELNLLPFFASLQVDMIAKLDRKAAMDSDQSRLVGVDLSGKVQPALESCKGEYARMLSECKWQYQEALDKLGQIEEVFTEAMERRRIIEKKIDQCEETLEAEREAQEGKLAVRQREADSIEQKIASLRNPVVLEEQMARFELECAELQVERQKRTEEYLAHKHAVCDEINHACAAISDYDSFCLEKIQEVQSYRAEKRASYGSLSPPSAN